MTIQEGAGQFHYQRSLACVRDLLANAVARLSPGERQDRASAILAQDKRQAREAWQRRRAVSETFAREVTAVYLPNRDRIRGLPRAEQVREAKALSAAYRANDTAELKSHAKASQRAENERRDRARGRQLDGLDYKRRQAKRAKQFGWRTPSRGQVAAEVCNPLATYRTYAERAEKFWRDAYAECPDLHERDPDSVRRDLLEGHELAKPTDPAEWDGLTIPHLEATSAKRGWSIIKPTKKIS